MKSSRIIFRLAGFAVVILLVGGLGALCRTQQKTIAALREQQLAQQRQLEEMDKLREELKAAQGLQNQQAEIDRLRESTKDLLRLRNEVRVLKEQVAELETLRAANAKLLQAVQGVRVLQSNQAALITSARKSGSILGINIKSPAAGRPGAEVSGIDANSPVATSGLAVGDLIYGIDGQRVQSPGELQAQMLTRPAGVFVMLDVLRGETPMRISVQTRPWPQ